MILNLLRGTTKHPKLCKNIPLLRSFASGSDDLYKTLGVDKGADKKDIKRAYKKATLKHHPDKGGDADEFKKIREAYEVLSDDQKRQTYDQFGMDGVNGQAGGFGGPGGPGGYGQQGPFGGGQGGDFNDFFDMFGGRGRGGFGGGGQPQQKMQLEPILLEYQVTLDDLYYGKNVEIAYHKTKQCKPCDGKGGKNVQKCGTCHGQGFTINQRNMGGMVMQTQDICHTCNGVGEVNFNSLHFSKFLT